jgi:hypothetical protein
MPPGPLHRKAGALPNRILKVSCTIADLDTKIDISLENVRMQCPRSGIITVDGGL